MTSQRRRRRDQMQQRPLPAPAVSPVYMSTTIIIIIVTCIHESLIETVTRAGHAVADFVGTAYFNSDNSPAYPCLGVSDVHTFLSDAMFLTMQSMFTNS